MESAKRKMAQSIRFLRKIDLVLLCMSDSVEHIETEYWDSLRKDDAHALEWLYDRYFGLLFNYGRKLSVEKKAVEDAIHDLFVDLWRYRENLSPTTSVRFYLYRALRRRLVRNQSAERFFTERAGLREIFPESVSCEEEDIIARETTDHRVVHLRRLLNDLSPRQYEAMTLRFYDELSFEEIGTILGVNEQSARNLVQRGLAQLKQFSKLLLGCLLLLIS